MKYLYFFYYFCFADLGENPPPIGSLALAGVWMEAETKEIRGGIMFPGSAKLWLEAQPQAENRGCLQISFRVFKNFYFFFRAARRPWRGTTDNMDNSTR